MFQETTKSPYIFTQWLPRVTQGSHAKKPARTRDWNYGGSDVKSQLLDQVEGKGDWKACLRIKEASIDLLFVAFLGVAVASAEKP